MFLLDTNILSELRKGTRANPGLIAWMETQNSYKHFVSVVSITELRVGALLVKTDPVQQQVLQLWIDGNVIPLYASRILPVTVPIAELTATLHVPTRRSFLDMFTPPQPSSTTSP